MLNVTSTSISVLEAKISFFLKWATSKRAKLLILYPNLKLLCCRLQCNVHQAFEAITKMLTMNYSALAEKTVATLICLVQGYNFGINRFASASTKQTSHITKTKKNMHEHYASAVWPRDHAKLDLTRKVSHHEQANAIIVRASACRSSSVSWIVCRT